MYLPFCLIVTMFTAFCHKIPKFPKSQRFDIKIIGIIATVSPKVINLSNFRSDDSADDVTMRYRWSVIRIRSGTVVSMETKRLC